MVRRGPHRARAARPVRVRACPSCSATTSPAARARRRARVLPDGRVARAGAAARRRARSSRPASWSTRCRASRARAAGSKATSLFAEVDENVDALRAAHAPPHRRDGARARPRGRRAGAGAVHAAPRPDDPRHPRHLLRPPRGRRPQHRRPPRRATATFYADEPFVRRDRRPPATKATLGSNAVHVTVRYDDAHRTPCSRIGALDNLVKGASGQAVQDANLRARPARDHRPPDDRDSCRERSASGAERPCEAQEREMSVTAVDGFEAGGLASGHQAVGRARPRARRHRRPRAGRRRGRVHHQPRRGGAGAGQPRAPRRRPRRGGRAQLRQRQRRHRRRRPRRRAAHVRAHRRRPRLRDHATCSCARPGSSASRCRWTPVEAGIPKLGAQLARRRRRRRPRRPQAHAHHRHRAQGDAAPTPSSATVAHVTRRRHGQGRGDARAVDGHDARGAHHRRRGRARRRCSALLERAVDDIVQRARRRRVHEHQRHRAACSRTARAGNPPISTERPRRTTRSVEALTAACADLARQMAADAEGATKLVTVVVRGARSRHEARRAARAVASQPARAVLALRRGPVLGSRALRARRERRVLRPRARRHRRTTASSVCRDGIAAAHDDDALARVDGSSATSRSSATCTRGHGEATMLFTDLTHAYVDENMGTS